MASKMRSLLTPNGRPNFGIYNEPFTNLDLAGLRLYGEEKRNTLRQHLLLRYRIKRWEYFGVYNEEIIWGAAMINLGYLSTAFTYVFDRARCKMYQYEKLLPGGDKVAFSGSSQIGIINIEHGDFKMSFRHTETAKEIDIVIKDKLSAEITMENSTAPLIYVGRVGLKGFNYTHKEAGIAVSGNIKLGEREWELSPRNSSGVMDYTLGQLPRCIFWNWAAGGGLDKNGNRLGFNLVQGINETGNTENAIWINDRQIKVDLTNFAYDDLRTNEAWHLTSADGKIDLNFFPEGERSADKNYGFVASAFKQLFGSFQGEISDGEKTYELEKVVGFTEEHFAKW